MDFTPIGNAANAADSTGRGAVSYGYNIGTYEVSYDMMVKANASGNLGISATGSGSLPAGGISWFEAVRFVNWLNTSQGYGPAYKFSLQPGNAGYTPDDNGNGIGQWNSGDAGYTPFVGGPSYYLYRNGSANYFLPSVDEWYKAAYYNPTTSTYADYATGSNTVPTPVAGGTTTGTAVYGNQAGPADITNAGGLSAYGTMGQNGNAYEWSENRNNLATSHIAFGSRLLLGGAYDSVIDTFDDNLKADNFNSAASSASNQFSPYGLRVVALNVAAVPEPSSLTLLCCCSIVSFAYLRKRRANARTLA